MRQTGKRGSGQWEEISWAEAIKLISDKFKSAAHSDIWVPVRPDTDGAMLLAMCNYTIDNDLIDYDYLRTIPWRCCSRRKTSTICVYPIWAWIRCPP